jgi:hypothetical protein
MHDPRRGLANGVTARGESGASLQWAVQTAELPAQDPHHPLAVRKVAMLTAALGVTHALLVVIAVLLIKTRAPGVKATDGELLAFYSDPSKRRVLIIAGLYLIPFAAIAFIWFFVALRMWVSRSARREDALLSNVQLVSGIIYTSLLLAAGASMTVLALIVELSDAPIDPLMARQFPQYGVSLILVFAMRMAAMFVLTTTNIGRKAAILPRWFVIVGLAVAVGLLLTASLSPWLILVFPGWILVFCIIVIERACKLSLVRVLPDRIDENPSTAGTQIDRTRSRVGAAECGNEYTDGS